MSINYHKGAAMIKRDSYLQRLIDRRNNGSVKINTGIRRRGKSALLFDLFVGTLLACGIPEDRTVKFAFDSEEDPERTGESMPDPAVNKRKVDPHKFFTCVKKRADRGWKNIIRCQTKYSSPGRSRPF